MEFKDQQRSLHIVDSQLRLIKFENEFVYLFLTKEQAPDDIHDYMSSQKDELNFNSGKVRLLYKSYFNDPGLQSYLKPLELDVFRNLKIFRCCKCNTI